MPILDSKLGGSSAGRDALNLNSAAARTVEHLARVVSNTLCGFKGEGPTSIPVDSTPMASSTLGPLDNHVWGEDFQISANFEIRSRCPVASMRHVARLGDAWQWNSLFSTPKRITE